MDVPTLDPDIAAWLAAQPAPSIDFGDVAAVRAIADSYMTETGGPAPRLNDPAVEVTSTQIAGVPVLVWAPRAAGRTAKRKPHQRSTKRGDVAGSTPGRAASTVLAFHGGGFITGGPLGAERIAVPLAAQHQIVTVSVGYRLAPEHRAPAQIDDGWAVLSHLHQHRQVAGHTLTGRVALHGSSAGGCIAAGLALRARDEGLEIALQSLSSPVLDDRSPWATRADHSMYGYSPTWSRADTIAAWAHYLGNDWPAVEPAEPSRLAGWPAVEPAEPSRLAGWVVPARADNLAGVAPAHITVAEHDVLRDEALDYASRLWAANVPVTVDRPSGTVHGFDGLLPDSTVAREAIAGQVQALARALRR